MLHGLIADKLNIIIMKELAEGIEKGKEKDIEKAAIEFHYLTRSKSRSNGYSKDKNQGKNKMIAADVAKKHGLNVANFTKLVASKNF